MNHLGTIFAFDDFDLETFANFGKLILHSQKLFVKPILYLDQSI